MPLIRYRVGDCGVFSEGVCDCGRTLPVIKQIEGRTDDILYTTDGRRIGRLDPIFKKDLPLIEAQIIQESLKSIHVKIVPAAYFAQGQARVLADRIRERMGDVHVRIEQVQRIPRTDRGKFRAVVCNLSAAERASVDG